MKNWQSWMGPAIAIGIIAIAYQLGVVLAGIVALAVIAYARYLDRKHPIDASGHR